MTTVVLADFPRPDETVASRPADALVEVREIREGRSPRLGGPDADHAAVLAESTRDLPPIVIHRPSMTVVDGTHRLLAAQMRGETCIRATFIDGTLEDAFVEATRSNVTHGKPLTLRERRRAARQVLGSFPEWSDRRIANACGLSPKTVGSIRRGLEMPTTDTRVGLDGRSRPVAPDEARVRIAGVLTSDPCASLRAVAATTGASVATVRDVRARLGGGAPPVTVITRSVKAVSDDRAFHADPDVAAFAAWFDEHRIMEDDWRPHIERLPLSRLYELTEEARCRAAAWAQLADDLETRARRSS